MGPLTAAGQKTSSQVRGRFALTMTALGTSRGDVDAVQGTGQFDNPNRKAQVSLDLDGYSGLVADSSGLGGLGGLADGLFDEPIELVAVGDTVYAKSTALTLLLGGDPAKPWVTFDAKQQTDKSSGNPLNAILPFGGGATGTSAFLDTIQGASDDVVDLGSESIDGVTTRHVRATIDPGRAKAKGIPNQFGQQAYPEDVWIGDDGVVRRVQYEIDPSKAVDSSGGLGGLGGLTALGGSGGSPLGQRLRITLAITATTEDDGQPVDISPPPADQVSPASAAGLPTGRGPATTAHR